MKTLYTLKIVETDERTIDIECDPHPTAVDLDRIIQLIGHQRLKLQPPVTEVLPATMSDLPVVPGPPGWFAGTTFPQGKVLGLRHTAFGWMVFAVPDGWVDDAAKALAAVDPLSSVQH